MQLEQRLLAEGYIDQATLAQAQALRQHRTLSDTLVSMGVIDEEQLCRMFGKLLDLPVWSGEGSYAQLDNLDSGFLAYNHILPVTIDDALWLILDDPEDAGLLDMLRRVAPEARLALYPRTELSTHLQQHPQIMSGADDEEDDELQLAELDAEHLKDLALEAPIIRKVNDIIQSAARLKASDIHFEPYRTHIELRFRVDGVLNRRPAPPKEEYSAIISRIKILANLDIAERRLPQDGRIRMKTAGRDIDIRVSTMPTPHGEDVVLRLLDQHREAMSLDQMSLSGDIVAKFREVLQATSGIVLVTGPTGAGKTTTLYAALQDLIDGQRKIITVEDPVEYEFQGITQIQVNPDIGMSFPAALRSILRHDPDIIFIGEIRDRETAEIAIQSALTGHLVLSTLHTNNALGAVSRFLDMEIPDYLLASALAGVSAQRLVRHLCPHCKEKISVPTHFANRFKLNGTQAVYQARGCSHCGDTGYIGRLPIAEFKVIDNRLRDVIVDHPTHDRLVEAADTQAGNMLSDGITKVLAGETTFEEVIRVAG